jgi:hypothetical protein
VDVSVTVRDTDGVLVDVIETVGLTLTLGVCVAETVELMLILGVFVIEKVGVGLREVVGDDVIEEDLLSVRELVELAEGLEIGMFVGLIDFV